MSCCGYMNRREFVGLTTAGIAGGVLGLTPSSLFAYDRKVGEWDPDKPLIVTGKKLKVQPVFMYSLPKRKKATSWKSWGGVQTEQAVSEEVRRISKELNALSARS